MKLKPILLTATGFFVASTILSFKSFKAAPDTLKAAKNISIYQDGKETDVVNDGTIPICKGAFSIRYTGRVYNEDNPKEFYAAKIAAFLDESELYKLKTGMDVHNIPCFQLGSGIAADRRYGYDALYFNNEGSHYLFYRNANDRRVNLLTENNQALRLEFPVSKFWIKGKYVAAKKAKLDQFYLAIFIDNNLNEIIDQGELTKCTIKLK